MVLLKCDILREISFDHIQDLDSVGVLKKVRNDYGGLWCGLGRGSGY